MKEIRDAIADEITALRQKNGMLAVEEVSRLLEHLTAILGAGGSATDRFLHEEIVGIACHIETTKREILALAPDETDGKSASSLQLDAVIRTTETAAHTIMDAADAIQAAIDTSNADAELKAKMTELTARIYEACNFQDLTSQRITKVMRALEFTEDRIRRLISLFASDGSVNPAEVEKAVQAAGRQDAHLLNGPQLPGNAPSQDEIDAMFGKQT